MAHRYIPQDGMLIQYPIDRCNFSIYKSELFTTGIICQLVHVHIGGAKKSSAALRTRLSIAQILY